MFSREIGACFFSVGARRAAKINSGRVSSANEDADTFAGLRFIPARNECGERGGAAGLRDDSQALPEGLLGLLNGLVSHARVTPLTNF
jgi:hypothetical protein